MRASRTTATILADDRSLSAGAVQAIHEDRDGMLWVGTGGGLDRMDPSTDGFTHYRHDPRDVATLSSDTVLPCTRIAAANLWIGTGAGLNVLEKTTGRISRFRHDPVDPHSLGHDFVSAIGGGPLRCAVGRLRLRQRAERPGREDPAVHPLFLSRGRADRARPHRSERALCGPRRRALAGHPGQGPAEAGPRAPGGSSDTAAIPRSRTRCRTTRCSQCSRMRKV